MRECSPPNMCQMSRVTCHVSCVMCHVSHVTCHVSQVTHILFYFISFSQSCEASRWRVCYQQGLPHLVFHHFHWPMARINAMALAVPSRGNHVPTQEEKSSGKNFFSKA